MMMALPNVEKGSGRRGTFILGSERFPLAVQDLPTIVESYKTYDDVNLVKTANIGQVRLLDSSGHAQVCKLSATGKTMSSVCQ